MDFPSSGTSEHTALTPGKRVRTALLLATLLLLGGCESLSAFLFFPQTPYVQYPDALGLTWEPVALETADGEQLANWWLPARGEPRGSVLFLHGNGENISTHLYAVAWLPEAGYNVLLLDYRGYGASTGAPLLPAVFMDIEAAHRWIAARSGAEVPLFLLGQSLGGSLGLYYLAHADPNLRPFRAAVIESAPASLPGIAAEAMRRHPLTWVLQLPAYLIPGAYDAADLDPEQIRLPVLLLHGDNDPVVPLAHGQTLAEQLASSPGFELQVYSGGHIQAFRHETLQKRVTQWFEAR